MKKKLLHHHNLHNPYDHLHVLLLYFLIRFFFHTSFCKSYHLHLFGSFLNMHKHNCASTMHISLSPRLALWHSPYTITIAFWIFLESPNVYQTDESHHNCSSNVSLLFSGLDFQLSDMDTSLRHGGRFIFTHQVLGRDGEKCC